MWLACLINSLLNACVVTVMLLDVYMFGGELLDTTTQEDKEVRGRLIVCSHRSDSLSQQHHAWHAHPDGSTSCLCVAIPDVH